MASRPRPQKCTVGAGTDALTLYVVPSRVAPFIGAVAPDDDDDARDITQTVRSHSRRRYTGGPSANVDGHSRQRTVGGYAAKETLPGRNAWFERRTTGLLGRITSRVQFTFVGTTAQLRDYVEANAVGQFILRTPDGEPVKVTA
jgi:alkanesulfonate monooxygenase SsuD/methylene tetrahydromethanopterin reductase-like flavin-dependent oxidoreductase (luciferase family)